MAEQLDIFSEKAEASTDADGRWKRYPAYKDSGIEWLGKIPEHWKARRLKHCLNLVNEKVDGWKVDLPYTGLEHIESWTGKRIPVADPPVSDSQANRFCRGDVLFGKLRPYLAKVLSAREEGICTGELLVLRPQAVTQGFLSNYMLAPAFVSIVDSSTYGTKMPRANWDFIGNLPLLIPPGHEQRAIAAFLDRETARIDALIEKKERQIELLQEKRTALISHAVTKGLDPTVPMKDSGIDWLGKIPAHWETMRLKFLLAEPLKYGANEVGEPGDPELPRYVRITDIAEDGTLREDESKSLPEDTARPYLLREGDLLFARSGATVGKTFLYAKSWGRAAYAGYLIRARFAPRRMLPRFAAYFSRSVNYWDWLRSSLIQATIENVSAEKYASLVLSVPPTDEQVQIVEYVDRETHRLDALASKVGNSIVTLREYRTALISAAVTGKIDVREESGESMEAPCE